MAMDRNNIELAREFFGNLNTREGKVVARTKEEMMNFVYSLEPNDDVIHPWTTCDGAGSKFGGDTIRISGSPEFVTAVLSRLKDVIILENRMTRLNCAHTIVSNDNSFDKSFAYAGGHVVYLHYSCRGEASGLGADRVPNATEDFLDRKPGLRAALERSYVEFLIFLGMSEKDAKARLADRKKKARK
jgi:hypothetical protein